MADPVRIVARKAPHRPADTARIQRALGAAGYLCSAIDAERMWEHYSEDQYAGWLIVDGYTDETIVAALRSYFELEP